MKKPVYLDYFSTTPCDPRVLEAMLPYFGEKFGNPWAKAHAAGRAAFSVFEEAMEKIASLIGAHGESITITSGATEANNLALQGMAEAATDRKEIVITQIEHNCVSNTAAHLAKKGFTIKTVPVNAEGFVEIDELKKHVSDRTLLVSVITASHELGTLQPLKECAKAAHDAGAVFHTDAVQAAGKISIDVEALDIDMLSFAPHKFYGPQGVGALYVRQKPPVAISPITFGGAQQKLRAGTMPFPLIVGFAKACEISIAEMEQNKTHLDKLVNLLWGKLQEGIPGIKQNGGTPRLPGLLNIRLPGAGALDVMTELAEDVCMSTGAACAAAARKPSPVLKAIGLSDEEVNCSLRLSVGRNSTEEEMLYAAEKLAEATKQLKAAA